MTVHTEAEADAVASTLEHAKEINLAVQQATAMARQIMRLERERDEWKLRAEVAERQREQLLKRIGGAR
jgi:serine protease inhibitor ecotin